MNKEQLKKLIREELKLYKNSLRNKVIKEEAKPVIDPDKAVGIVTGAVKTLFNSGAITGADPARVADISKEIIKHLDVALAPYKKSDEVPSDNLNDEESYKKEEDTLGDQSQYDADLSKQTSDKKEKEPEAAAEEPLFEVSKISKKLKL